MRQRLHGRRGCSRSLPATAKRLPLPAPRAHCSSICSTWGFSAFHVALYASACDARRGGTAELTAWVQQGDAALSTTTRCSACYASWRADVLPKLYCSHCTAPLPGTWVMYCSSRLMTRGDW